MMVNCNIVKLFVTLVCVCCITRCSATPSTDDSTHEMTPHRQLAENDWYARLVGTFISSAAKATATAHLPAKTQVSSDTTVKANTTTPTSSTSSGFLSGSMNPGNWFSARAHTPTVSTSSSSTGGGGGGISSWVSSITNYFSGFKTQRSSTDTTDGEESISVPSFTPIYGKRNKYSPRVPYFNTLLPQHQSAVPCIAISLTSDHKYMYSGKAQRPWEAQAAALKRCYHDGQEECKLADDIGVVSMGACVAVAKSQNGILYAATSTMQDDEGLQTKQKALSTCAHAGPGVCTVEYFDCPV